MDQNLFIFSIEGGVENNYVYPPDPVNDFDLSGQYVETAVDVASFGYSANQFRKNKSLGNFGFAAFDGVMIFVPIVPGTGVFRAGGKAIGNSVPKNFTKMTNTQLKKQVRTLDKQIVKHKTKIKNQPNSIHRQHWEKEIQQFKVQIQQSKKLLKSRKRR